MRARAHRCGRRAPGSGFAAALVLAVLAAGCATARPKVLVIGVDGLRPDQLELSRTPALDALAANGAITLAATNAETGEQAWNGDGAASWGVLLTGVGPERSGLTRDGDDRDRIDDDAWVASHAPAGSWAERMASATVAVTAEVEPTGVAALLDGDPDVVPTIFGRLKAVRPRAETACFATWSGIGLAPGSILGDSRAAVDCFFSPADEPGAADRSAADRDRDTATAAVEALSGAGRFAGADVDLAFVHLSQCDAAGRAGGFASEAYRASIASADALVGELLSALEARPAREHEQWLVIVASDHGGEGDAGEHAGDADPLARTIPMIVAADGILPRRIDLAGASLYDVAPTVMRWLGLAPDRDLPGRPLVP